MGERELLAEIWEIDFESHWDLADFQPPDAGLARLGRLLEALLASICRHVSTPDHAYIAITGLELGQFTPIASVGRPVTAIHSTPTSGAGTLVAEYLQDLRDHPILIANPSQHAAFKGDSSVAMKVLLPLASHGECFGFISLDARKDFDQRSIDIMTAALPVIATKVADAVFSRQLRFLGEQLIYPASAAAGVDNDRQALLWRAVQAVALGLAADGAVLRLFDAARGVLHVEAFAGEVDDALTQDLALGEGAAGFLAADPAADWGFSQPFGDQHNASPLVFPTAVSGRLRDAGIHSYAIAKLPNTDASGMLQPIPLGTVSLFHRRPHRFSWRDIALFTSFARRAAETIILNDRSTQLLETIEKMRRQDVQLTRAEIIALLGHDLTHRSIHNSWALEQLVNSAHGVIRHPKEKRFLDAFADNKVKAQTAAHAMQTGLTHVRALTSQFTLGDRVTFEVADVIASVKSTLEAALERYQIKFDIRVQRDIRLTGYREVFMAILFNLVINAIEAIRSRNLGQSVIHFSAHTEQSGPSRRAIIYVSDDGPGINQARFRDPNEIFDLGATSKPDGTGTGLPVSRSLLGTFFDGSLVLEDAKKALFRLTIPLADRRAS